MSVNEKSEIFCQRQLRPDPGVRLDAVRLELIQAQYVAGYS